MEKIPFTQAGLDKTKSELHQLKNVERQQVIHAIADAREHGDLSENAEYHAARERQSFIEGRIKELEDVTSRAEVIDASRITGKTVTFGVTVVIVDELTDEFIKKNNSFVEQDENDFEFNQDIDFESEIRSPGWIRYQKKLKW